MSEKTHNAKHKLLKMHVTQNTHNFTHVTDCVLLWKKKNFLKASLSLIVPFVSNPSAR